MQFHVWLITAANALPDAPRRCAELLAQYYNVTKHSDCPADRHAVEELYFQEACKKPSLRLCRSRAPYSAGGGLLHRVNSNVNWANFKPLRNMHDAIEASVRGHVKGVYEPAGGTQWGARNWNVVSMAATFKKALHDNY